MNKPLLSILIPAYNRSGLLRQTLESLLRQTVFPEDVEVLVSDDCSRDDTWSVIGEYEGKLKNMKSFRQPANRGGACNWEFLLQQAVGEYVFLLCDDDAVAPDFLETYLGLLSKDPGLDMVFADLELRSPAFESLAAIALDTPEGPSDGVTRCREQLRSTHMVMTTVYRRSTLLAAGGWDPSVGSHLDCTAFCRAALRARRTWRIGRPMLYFRITSGSWSHSLATQDQGRLARWYRRKLDLIRADAKALHPEMLSFLESMYLWHGRGVLAYLELELAKGRSTGAATRTAMSALLEVFPEARGTLTAVKLWLASWLGTWWLRGLRKLFGKPDPYDTPLALFNSFPPAA